MSVESNLRSCHNSVFIPSMIGLEKLPEKFSSYSLSFGVFLIVYWAFYKLNIHKGVCIHFVFILGGLVVPLGLFWCFLFKDLSLMFLSTSIIVASLNLGHGESCAVAVNASAIAQRPRKFIKGFSSPSLSSFWSELLAFSYRCQPQGNRWRQKTPVLSDTWLAFFVLIWCPNGHSCCHVFKLWTRTKVVDFRICNASESNVKLHIIEKFSIACKNWSGIAFVCFTSVCEWCRKRAPSSSTNQMQNENKA